MKLDPETRTAIGLAGSRNRRQQLTMLRRRLDRYEELLDRRAEFMPPHQRGSAEGVMDGCRHCAVVQGGDPELEEAIDHVVAAVSALAGEVSLEERAAWPELPSVAAIGG